MGEVHVINRTAIHARAVKLKDIENVEKVIAEAKRNSLKVTAGPSSPPEVAVTFYGQQNALKLEILKVLQDWVDSELRTLEMIEQKG